jgi:lipopolysaccharide heptosyltransferase I
VDANQSRDQPLAGVSFDRILLIKPSSLGDVIHALPVLHGLRSLYPQAEIDWLVSSSLLPLLQGQAGIDRLVPFDRQRFGRLGRSWSASKAFGQFLGDLRRRQYQLVIDLQGLFRTGFMARASGAPHRIGFRSAREAAWMFYNHHIPAMPHDAHAVDRNRAACRLLGLDDCPREFGFRTRPDADAEAKNLLGENGSGDDRPFLAVVPGARWDTKMWFPERFAEVINKVGTESGTRTVLLGGPEDADRCDQIADQCQVQPVNLAGKTGLAVLPAVLNKAACVLCHDSGAMHIAVALDRPLVCLTGPTNPSRTGPYRRLQDVMRLDLECSPCYLRKLARCQHEHRCMTGLEPAQVADAVLARLVQGVEDSTPIT